MGLSTIKEQLSRNQSGEIVTLSGATSQRLTRRQSETYYGKFDTSKIDMSASNPSHRRSFAKTGNFT